jgi:hypothetical protein
MMTTTSMSFTVAPVGNDEQLRQACAVRAASYGHHVPALGRSFAEPDALDESGRATSFLALDKMTGRAVGTLRVQMGCAEHPLMLESSYTLPGDLPQQTRAELTRMSVLPKADPLIRLLLWKAGYYFCLAKQIQCMVIGARRPALIKQYKHLGFSELTEAPVPFAHTGGMPHSVLHFDVRSAERRWHHSHHALYDFMFATHHPDMDVIGPVWRPTQVKRQAAAHETAEVLAAAAGSAAEHELLTA